MCHIERAFLHTGLAPLNPLKETFIPGTVISSAMSWIDSQASVCIGRDDSPCIILSPSLFHLLSPFLLFCVSFSASLSFCLFVFILISLPHLLFAFLSHLLSPSQLDLVSSILSHFLSPFLLLCLLFCFFLFLSLFFFSFLYLISFLLFFYLICSLPSNFISFYSVSSPISLSRILSHFLFLTLLYLLLVYLICLLPLYLIFILLFILFLSRLSTLCLFLLSFITSLPLCLLLLLPLCLIPSLSSLSASLLFFHRCLHLYLFLSILVCLLSI